MSGRTLLEITLSTLRSFGIREVIINVHHFADMVIQYLQSHNNFGMRIAISREDVLLDTGGGLKKAAPFFLEESARPEEPFIVHNVDVISSIDLLRLVRFHNEHRALATLAVQQRQTSRYLLFDPQSELCGRRFVAEQKTEWARPSDEVRELAFSGIHVISPRLLTLMSEQGAFSIVACYLRLAAQVEKIMAFRADEFYWRDLGKPGDIKQAEDDLTSPAVERGIPPKFPN